MYRHSPLVILSLLMCVFVSCTGGGGGEGGSATCLNPKTTTNAPPLDEKPIQPSAGQHPALHWGTENDVTLLDVRMSIRGKTGILSPAAASASAAAAASSSSAAAGHLVPRDRRSASFSICQATLATKIDNCTQTFERLFVQHMLTTARTSITQLEAQRLCRQHDESLYCLHIELMACHPREDHLERIAEEIGYFRDYMERLCRYVRQTSSSSLSSTAPIFSSPPLESYMLHRKFNQLKHAGVSAMQKTATDRVEPATDITPNSFGHVSHSNLSSKMFLNGNAHNEDKDSEFNKKLHHKMSNIKASKENSTEADDVRTSQNAAAATMTIVEPQILAKQNNPHTRNSCPSQLPDFRCLCIQFIFGFILTAATCHLH